MWRAAPPEDLVWNTWDDEFVVFHRPSGRTHFLNAASAEIITRHLSRPASTVDIADAYPSPDETINAEHHLEDILSLLERFEHLGLIKRV
jgi:PqqD family protein of HPr-rel-A system